VPHNSLPHRPQALTQLTRHFDAATFAHFNILRVCGGGVYASNAFMDLADAAGILIFQDAMLGDQFYNTQPSFLREVGKEVEDTLFRLGHHPSLGVLCGSNEMASGYSDQHHLPPSSIPFYSALYFDTVLANFSALLPFTPTLSSTPSNGNETAAHPWSSSEEIITRGDIHFYALDEDCLNISLYPRARWVTEHGWESEPSFFTLAPTLGGPGDYSFNSSMVAARQQHPPGQGQITFQVELNWGWPHTTPPHPHSPFSLSGHPSLLQRTARYHRLVGQAQSLVLDGNGGAAAATQLLPLHPYLQQLSDPTSPAAPAATVFRDELHMTQVTAGQCLRTAIERWRSFADDFSEPGGGTAGILYWQFAEPWAGPSWSSREVGGRLKVGHYMVARGFAPMLVTGVVEEGGVLALDASFTTYDPALLPHKSPGATGVLTLTAFAWAGGVLGSMSLPALPLPPPHTSARLGALALAGVLKATGCPAPSACVLTMTLVEEGVGGKHLAANHLLLPPPKAFVGALPNPGLAISSVVGGGGGGGALVFNVTVTSALVPVPMVWLETPIVGAWSDNGLLLLERGLVLTFKVEEPVEPATLAASLAISSLYDIYGAQS